MSIIKINTKSLRVREDSGRVYFTYRDIESFPEWPDSDLIEIINGDLFIVPSTTISHQRISSKLEFQLQLFLQTNKLGEVLHAPIDVVLSEENVVIPDIIFVLNDNRSIIKDKNIEGSPDLIIEITSTNKKRDLISKKQLYEKYRVKEYIIINPEENFVLTYILGEEGKYNKGKEYKLTQSFPIHTLNNLIIKVDDIIE